MILFIKQTAVFFTSKNFLVTFTMNLFVTKLSLVRSASGRQRHVVLPRGSWKKAFQASFSQEDKTTHGRHVVLDLFING